MGFPAGRADGGGWSWIYASSREQGRRRRGWPLRYRAPARTPRAPPRAAPRSGRPPRDRRRPNTPALPAGPSQAGPPQPAGPRSAPASPHPTRYPPAPVRSAAPPPPSPAPGSRRPVHAAPDRRTPTTSQQLAHPREVLGMLRRLQHQLPLRAGHDSADTVRIGRCSTRDRRVHGA